MEELIAVLESMPHRNELAVRSSRTAEVKKCAEEVLGLCKLQQGNKAVSKLASELITPLKSLISTDSKLDRKKRREGIEASYLCSLIARCVDHDRRIAHWAIFLSSLIPSFF